MTKKFKRLALLIFSVVFSIVISLGYWASQNRDVQIAYHQYFMEIAKEKMWQDPTNIGNGLATLSLSERQERKYKYHRQELIELGVIEKFEYRFKYIMNSSPEYRSLHQSLNISWCPPIIDFRSPYIPNKNTHMIFWCEAVKVKKLKEFLEVQDQAAVLNSNDSSEATMP
ncbi:MAG: hypothetical protein ACF8OB_08330 [Phycisphaeraceae bacterium JB051]